MMISFLLHAALAYDANGICPVGYTVQGYPPNNQFCQCQPLSGNNEPYQMVVGGAQHWGTGAQTTLWETEVRRGAEAWNGYGTAALNGMAVWRFNYDGRVSSAQNHLGDATIGVFKNNFVMWILGESLTHGLTLNWYTPSCTKTSFDVLLNDNFAEPNAVPGSSLSRYWTSAGPDTAGAQGYWHDETIAMRLVVGHEFGHGMGLHHYNTRPALMNEFPEFAGDAGQLELHGNFASLHPVRLQEDDAMGLSFVKPGFLPRINFAATLSDSYNARSRNEAPGQTLTLVSPFGSDLDVVTNAEFCAVGNGDILPANTHYDSARQTAAIVVTADWFFYPQSSYPYRSIRYQWDLVTRLVPRNRDATTPSQAVYPLNGGTRSVRMDGVRTYVNAPVEFPEVDAGAYYLRFCIDTSNSFLESSEEDNCAFSALPSFVAVPCN